MIKNYLTIAIRNLRRYKGYAFINIGGLAVGIACCVLIIMYVRDELGYDAFHADAERVFRVEVGEDQTVTPTIIAPLFKRTFPEVEHTTRLYDIGRFRPVVMEFEDRRFIETGFFYADSTVFDVLTFPFIVGTPEEALTRPNTIVLTASLAQKYFGSANPIGEIMSVGSGTEYEVTGVIEDVPGQSHVQFDLLASFSSTHWSGEEIWSSANFYTYIKVRDLESVVSLRSKIGQMVETAKAEQQVANSYALRLVPVTDIRLYGEGKIQYVYLLSAIALMLILIACVNYVNLATARASRRSREVGIRKVAGAERKQLFAQFMGESFLLTGLALVVAILLIEMLLPVFNNLSGKSLEVQYLTDPQWWGVLLGIVVLVGLVAGSYPALVLASVKPASIFKPEAHSLTGGKRLRRMLVVFQFTLSIVFIVGTLVVYQQLNFIQQKNLGFDKEQVLVLPIGDQRTQEAAPLLREALLQHPQILQASTVNHIPGHQRGGYALIADGLELPENEYFPIGGVPVDPYVVETLGLTLISGTDFTESADRNVQDGSYQYLVNRAAIEALGWDEAEAVGKRMGLSSNRMGTLVGVIEDYHFLSLHQQIYPMAFFVEPQSCNYLLVKMAPGQVRPTLDVIETAWNERITHRPFTYSFLDEEINALYRSEQQTGQVFALVSLIAVLIACLGLFGLAAFATARRTKEVGIRKVLGATVGQIIMLLSREFTILVSIAFLVATPPAVWIMSGWLENFAYQVELSWQLFVISGLVAMFIAWLTVSYQAIRAARANPVKALRYE